LHYEVNEKPEAIASGFFGLSITATSAAIHSLSAPHLLLEKEHLFTISTAG
jgi:hypothetical protein